MFVFLALVALCNAQLYGQSCDSDADCDGGFCLMTTCRPYSEKDEYCNLYRKCKNDHVCKQNICVDNSTELPLVIHAHSTVDTPSTPLSVHSLRGRI